MNKDKTNWGNFPVHIAVEGENFFHFLREKIKSADIGKACLAGDSAIFASDECVCGVGQ